MTSDIPYLAWYPSGDAERDAEAVRTMAAKDARHAETGRGYLSLAVLENNRALFDALLEAGIDVDATDGTATPPHGGYTPIPGPTALHTALQRIGSEKEPVWVDDGTDHYLNTRFDPFFVEALLEKGAAVDPVNAVGYTPLGLAAAFGHFESAEALVAQGADVNHGCRAGIFRQAVSSPYFPKEDDRMMRLLIDAGADAEVSRTYAGAGIKIIDFPDERWDRYRKIHGETVARIRRFMKHPADTVRADFLTGDGKATLAFTHALAFGFFPELLKYDHWREAPQEAMKLWKAVGPYYRRKYQALDLTYARGESLNGDWSVGVVQSREGLGRVER